MTADAFFEKKQVRFERLIPFGFVREGTDYRYEEDFMDGSFRVQVRIAADGSAETTVLDKELDEEYLPFRAGGQSGPFVSQVREACGEILERLAAACFDPLPFRGEQSNRLARRIAKEWGDPYDHPFTRYPDYVSYRIRGKWYALIFPLKLEKLAGMPEERGKQEAEVLNIKVAPDQRDSLLEIEGIYPSYHMSKKNWVTLILDDSLSDAQIWELLTASKRLTNPSGRADGPDFWLLPANPKYYGVDAEFAASHLVSWPQKASIRQGDYVAIYITAPVRALRYFCRVLSANSPGQADQQTMTLELLQTFRDDQFSTDQLKALGVTNIRSARRASPALAEALAAVVKP